MNRVASRQIERAANRDPLLEAALVDVYKQDEKDNSLAQIMMDEQGFKPTA